MKLKSMFVTALAAASFGSLANAQTVIDLVGSTAARGAVHDKIQEMLNGSGNTLTSFAYNSSNGVLSSNQAIFHGTIGANPVIIRTYWAGSVNGIRDIAQQVQQTNLYLTSVAGNATGQVVSTSGNLAGATPESAPEIGFSDVFATSTQFAPTAVEDEVAVLPFKFYKNDGAPAALDNITPLLVQTIYGVSQAPLALFTGNPDDQGSIILAVGRDNLSGTRITAMAESGYGVFNSVAQYGGTAFTTSGDTITAMGTTVDDSGAGSGGTVAGWLNKSLAGDYAGFSFIAYLGPTDWAAAESTAAFSGPAVALKWNGIAYSEQAVREGQYTFWGYLHQNRNNGLAGTSLTFYNALRDALTANPENSLISVSSMNVERLGDGEPVLPKY